MRGLSAPGFLGVDVGSRGQKRLGRVHLAAARGGHQRSFAVRGSEIGIGAGFEQRFNDRRGADDGGFGEGRRAELVLQFDIRAGFDQRADQFEVVVRRGVHDGGAAIGAGGVHVRALRARQAHGRGVVAGFRRVKQRRLGGQPVIDAPASRTAIAAANLRMPDALNLRKTFDAVADGFHRDLIALEQRQEQVAVTRILGILQVLAAFDLSVGVSQDRGRQRIVVVAIAVAHVAAEENRGMIEHGAVGFFRGLDLLDESGEHLVWYF